MRLEDIQPPQTLEEFERDASLLLRPPPVTAFGRIKWSDLDKPGQKETTYLVDDWMTEGDKSIIGGASGAGKSFLAIDMGLAIARGVEWLGSRTRPGLVIYQAGEGGRGVKNRLRAYRKHHGIGAGEEIPFELLTSRIDIYAADDKGGDTKKLIAAIMGIAAEYPSVPLKAVFIDTLATAQGAADEISGKDMAAVLNNIDLIQRETGAHVCLVHHLNQEGRKLRGHTSLRANVDQVLVVTQNEQTKVKTVTLDKIKDGEDGLKVQFELMQIVVGIRDNGKDLTSCVCLPVGQKEAIRKEEEAKGIRLKDSEIPYFRAVLAALEVHGKPVPAEMDLPSHVRSVVENRLVNQAYVSQHPMDEDTRGMSEEEVKAAKIRHWEKLKKRVQAAREGLMRARLIGVGDNMVWWTGRPARGFPQTMPHSPKIPDESPGDFPPGSLDSDLTL